MRILFLVANGTWSARARAFVVAARGLAARGHDVLLACESDCPVQVRAASAELAVVPLDPRSGAAGDTLQLRRAIQEKPVDVVFVHTNEEHLIASSAMKLGRGAGAVIRRIPPFALAGRGKGSRMALRLAPSGLLFSTEADRTAAVDQTGYRLAAALAPLGVDTSEYAAITPVSKVSLGAPPNSRLVVCVHDGVARAPVLAALRTLAILAPRHRALHLVVLGPSLDEIRMQGAALGVNTMVSYLGPREDELAIVRAADVGWIAAEGDAAAFAALDFMSCGLGVIAERSVATEHYIADGIAGLLLPSTEPSVAAGAVASFLMNQDQRASMGNAARARVQREFPLDRMIDGFEQAAVAATRRNSATVA